MAWGEHPVVRAWPIGMTSARSISIELQQAPQGRRNLVLVSRRHADDARAFGIVVPEAMLETLHRAIGEALEHVRGAG